MRRTFWEANISLLQGFRSRDLRDLVRADPNKTTIAKLFSKAILRIFERVFWDFRLVVKVNNTLKN